jgi:hypothetical protein
MSSMRRLVCLLLAIGAVDCAQDSTIDGAAARPNDSGSTDAPGCPGPVDCADSKACDLPPPVPRECLSITAFHRWTECSNGYVIIAGAAENSGFASYYRDGKLFAAFATTSFSPV